MITSESILKILPDSKVSETVSRWFNEYAAKYEVTTPLRIAAFFAQVMHESGNFRYVREIWGPSKQQLKYERDFNSPWPETSRHGRNYVATNLGNAFVGDGKFFSGHGYIQITGRTNHTSVSHDLFNDDTLIRNPQLLSVPQYAMLSAFWFWGKHDLNKYADKQWMETITKRINGGLTNFDDRVKIYNRIADLFSIPHYIIKA